MFIAEIGINHQGDLTLAKELILMAKNAGVKVVKFQKRNPDKCVPEDQKNVIKDSIFGQMTYLEYKRRIEFGKDEYDEIDRYCKELDMKWTASPWDIDSLHFLLQYDLPFIKIASASVTDLELLSEVRRQGIFAILSTGMSTEHEIENAVNTLGEYCIAILHCNSEYPSNLENINLLYMKALKRKYPRLLIGYSGHEIGILPTLVAASMKADIIERHITLDTSSQGSDHKASLDPVELKKLMNELSQIEIILGRPSKVVSAKELEMSKKLRLKKGEK